jgi:hypothetical protein
MTPWAARARAEQQFSNFSPECPLDASAPSNALACLESSVSKLSVNSGEGLLDLRFAPWEQSTADVRYYLVASIAATDNATLPNGRSQKLGGNSMRMTIPLVVLVAVLVGPSAVAQSPSQDNAAQRPNSGAGVPGLPGNKSGPAHRPNGMSQDAHTGTSPDQSNVPGLPGTKSGPGVQPPQH